LGHAEEHQFSLAQLIRDAQYAIDHGDTIFAPGFKALLQDACADLRRSLLNCRNRPPATAGARQAARGTRRRPGRGSFGGEDASEPSSHKGGVSPSDAYCIRVNIT
jgi:hypothetical protein